MDLRKLIFWVGQAELQHHCHNDIQPSLHRDSSLSSLVSSISDIIIKNVINIYIYIYLVHSIYNQIVKSSYNMCQGHPLNPYWRYTHPKKTESLKWVNIKPLGWWPSPTWKIIPFSKVSNPWLVIKFPQDRVVGHLPNGLIKWLKYMGGPS